MFLIQILICYLLFRHNVIQLEYVVILLYRGVGSAYISGFGVFGRDVESVE